MKKLLVILIMLFTTPAFASKLWVCWYNQVNNNECGSYGWDKNKKSAEMAAENICEQECRNVCYKVYCEKINKIKK